ncbi:MAG: hypothetical protein AAF845_09100 [Bacteroidota bacterium]
MSRLVLAASLLLGACASAPPAPEADGDLRGAYVAEHDIQLYGGEAVGWETTSVTDVLEVDPRGDSLDVYALLVATNAHLCEFDLTLGPEADGAWQAATDWGCRLRLVAGPDTIRLEDPDNVCRRRLCGARAVIDGAQFPRPPVDTVGALRVSR